MRLTHESALCSDPQDSGLCLTMVCPTGKGLGEVEVLNVSFWVSLALTFHGRALWAPAHWWTAWSWGWWMMSTRNQSPDLVRLTTEKKIRAWILLFLGLRQITYENNYLKMQLLKNGVTLPNQRWLELAFVYFDYFYFDYLFVNSLWIQCHEGANASRLKRNGTVNLLLSVTSDFLL